MIYNFIEKQTSEVVPLVIFADPRRLGGPGITFLYFFIFAPFPK